MRKAAKYNIYIIIDAHQDLGLRKFCGEGFPNYVGVNITTKFPEIPYFWWKLDYDEKGNPTWESCLKHIFSYYYPTLAVS